MSDTTLSPDPQPPPAPKKKSSLPKILKFGCGGIVLLFIVGIIGVALQPKEAKEAKRKADSIESVADAAQDRQEEADAAAKKAAEKEAAAASSIGVSRKDIEQTFSSLSFEKGVNVNGEDNYIATSTNGTIIQLIGPKGALSRASLTIVVGSDPEKTSDAGDEGKAFIRAIDPDAGPWIGAALQKLAGSGGGKDYSVIGERRFEVSVTSIGEIATASISVKPK